MAARRLQLAARVVDGERPEITLRNMREVAVVEAGALAPGPDADAFFDDVDARLGRGRKRELLIYMHGADTSVERAAGQAAQFQHFPGRDELDVLAIRAKDLPDLPADSRAFWYEHPWVSSDVLLKLRFHAGPPARGLGPNRDENEVAFWTFPHDYAERLPAVARALAKGRNP